MPSEPRLPFDDEPPAADTLLGRDEAARGFAVDPSRNVVLEASAGTGKTRVLVTRYVNLLRAGVDPANILAVTFTRKAAAEMRERILHDLRALAADSPADRSRWRALGDRLGDIAICTIDAFCLSLLREFPLEADLDPGFQVADETEVPRLVDEALDAALRAGRRLAARDEDLALLIAGLGERRLRQGLGALLNRRLVAGRALRRFLSDAPTTVPSLLFARASSRLSGLLSSGPGALDAFGRDGPRGHPAFALIEADLRALVSGGLAAPAGRSAVDRVAAYFLKSGGQPRSRPARAYSKEHCASPDAWKRHSQAVGALAPLVADLLDGLDRDLNGAMARGLERLYRIAVVRYRRSLDDLAKVDFSEGLARTLSLLRRMDEFAQSRYRLEARYHHVLLDEFQDTSRPQWRLVARLIESWGEGAGLAHDAPLQPSIFVVGDRKQSIYAFRDADVRMLGRARRHIRALRPGGRVGRSIARSFRSAAPLLAFANDLFAGVDQVKARRDAFRFGPSDAFPVALAPPVPVADEALGLVVGGSATAVAAASAAEIDRLLSTVTVRDRRTGLPRRAMPGDIAILFRSRETHRQFASALEARRIPTYVYKGLGFFDADEVKDLVALLRYLARPASDARAAALLRSRFVRLSDPALRRLAPRFAALLLAAGPPPPGLAPEDGRVLSHLRASVGGWLSLVDRVPPSELLDRVLEESAYTFELGGARQAQARENLKKVRALLRRIQNGGYATLGRVAEQLERLSAGDESNAVVDAVDAVNLMTVHAAKGLEFPIVFLVNLGRGTGAHGDPVVLVDDARGGRPLVSIDGGLRQAEEALRARDLEETKRLLYVAVTRARERLYLSAVVAGGRFKPTRGSLGEVLPDEVRELFVRAASSAGASRVEWRPPGGSVHAFAVRGPVAETVEPAVGQGLSVPDGPPPCAAPDGVPSSDPLDSGPSDDFAAWRDTPTARRLRVTPGARAGVEADPGATGAPASVSGRPGDRLVGTLVHRLFQSTPGADALADSARLAARSRALLSEEDLDAAESADAVVAEALAVFARLRARPEFATLLDSADCLYEVPFSLCLAPGVLPTGQEPGQHEDREGPEGEVPEADRTVIRGTIDCLAQLPDGSVKVVEIKTGSPRNWHAAQLDCYVRAARAIFPGRPVDGIIVYA